MKPGQSCSNCAAFAPLESQCRKRAPRAFLTMGPNGQPQVLGAWPGALGTQWCCDWEPDINAGAANDSAHGASPQVSGTIALTGK